jgi:hypothetical protein
MAFCPKCGKDIGVSTFCPACGASASATSGPGVAAAAGVAPAPVKKKSRRGLIIFLLLAFIVGFIGYVANVQSDITEAKKPTVMNVPCKKEAGVFMELMREGDRTYTTMWKPGSKAVTLYDVRKVDDKAYGNLANSNGKPFSPARVYYQFQVESSTQGGIPIVKVWELQLEPSSKDTLGSACAVVSLASAQ